MSNAHNQLATVKLTDENKKAVDRRAGVESRAYKIKVSRAAVANKSIAIGIKHLNKEKL